MNREMKRKLQRDGEIDADGAPLATARPARQQGLSSRPTNAPRGTPLSYLRGVRNELRKVAWPTPEEVRKYSTVVLIALLVLTALIFFLDNAFTQATIFLFK